MARNSEVILATLKLDRTYKSVIDYSESDMYSLVWANKNQYVEKCNYLREEKAIEVQLTMAQCLTSNYLAFRNTDYEYKWFFAFIDKVEYVNNAVSRIYFTIDIWSTWHDYWSKKPCYIIRQHQNTDVAGDNLVPEGLEHGEYIINTKFESTKFKGCFIGVLASISGSWDGSSFTPSGDAFTKIGSNGILNGALYICNSPQDAFDLIDAILSITSPKQGEILEVYMIPKTLFPTIDPSTTNIYNIAPDGYTVYTATESIFASKPTNVGGYFPHNKKLLTFPYTYILASNSIGNTCVWKWEDFLNASVSVNYFGVPTVGCSILSCPASYKGDLVGKQDALIGAKYPTLGWREDSYTNWLTQNSVNNTVNQVTTVGQIVAGASLLAVSPFTGGTTALMGAGLLTSGGINALESAGEYYKHSIEPDNIKGLISAGDVLSCVGDMGFIYYNMSIKSDYASRLDTYFTRYGYRQNKVQTPLWGDSSYRRRWNYIQISNDSEIGVPKVNSSNHYTININDMESINNMFRSGITIFKLYTEYNDFDLSNEIVTPTP